MLEDERKYLINAILRKGHHPIAMEFDFGGANTALTIEVDKKKIEESDCVVVVLGHLYGEIISSKIGGRKSTVCPFCKNESFAHENCDECYGANCHISFTHFEYLYALSLHKPVYVILYEPYDNQDAFEEKHNRWKKEHRYDCLTLWGNGREKNRKFVNNVNQHMRFQFSSFQQFEDACTNVLDMAIKQMDTIVDCGLVPFNYNFRSGNNSLSTMYTPITFFTQDQRPKETLLPETIRDAVKFYFMARTGVTFLSRYTSFIRKAIEQGCECRFIVLSKGSEMIRNGRYETAFDEKNTEVSMQYLKSLKEFNPELVHVHSTDFYPTFDIEYFETRNGEKSLLVQTHFLISHLGPDRPMFMLYEHDYWYQTFKDEWDQMWDSTSEMEWS